MKNFRLRTVERIQKQKAEQLYNAGFDVLFAPCNINPENDMWGLGMWQNKYLAGQYKDFASLVNAYTNYNCNGEVGRYISFYVKLEPIDISFIDGGKILPFQGSARECLAQLHYWGKLHKITIKEPGVFILQKK